MPPAKKSALHFRRAQCLLTFLTAGSGAMKFFIDTADLAEIRALAATGLVDGVTTNPSLIAKSVRGFLDAIAEIFSIVGGPVSAEVTATHSESMVKEGRKLAAIARHGAGEVPLPPEWLEACRTLAEDGTMVNVTLCFSAAQAILAAKAGAAFVSPFVGRLDDIRQDGLVLLREIIEIYDSYSWGTEVLAASIRHPIHVIEAARMGCDVATLPF